MIRRLARLVAALALLLLGGALLPGEALAVNVIVPVCPQTVAGSILPAPTRWTVTATPASGSAITGKLDSSGCVQLGLSSGSTSPWSMSVSNGTDTFPLTPVSVGAGGAVVGTNGLSTGSTIPNPTLSGTVSGTPTWASNQAITLSTAAQPNITSLGTLSSLTTNGGLITFERDANGGVATLMSLQNLGTTNTSNGILLNWQFNNSTPAVTTFASETVTSPTNTAGAEQADILWKTMQAGSLANAMRLSSGLQVGAAPTGGDQGVGTINVSSNIYLNGGAYTNPDYVLEKYFTGRIVRYADKPGAKGYTVPTLADVENHARQNLALPGFGQTAGLGLFDGGDNLLARLEEAYIFLFQHDHRIVALEQENRDLKTQLASQQKQIDGLAARLDRAGIK